jgi:UDP-glucose 4-epimerase
MKRALVTGGCGFIGSSLTKELVRQGWQVDVVDDMSSGKFESLEGLKLRILPNAYFLKHYAEQVKNREQKEVLVIQDDFATPQVLAYVSEYDVVFHQAAMPRVTYSVEYPAETTNNNITKTVSLLQACAQGTVDRVVFASSSSVYGGEKLLPTKECYGKDPKSPYAWQKSAIEDYAKICWHLWNLDIVCLRYFNVFGPGQYGDSPYATAVSAWCHAIKNDLECRSDGDGEQSRDMCYIDNVVNANILAANADGTFKGVVYNIACGNNISNNQILEYLKKQLGNKVKVKHTPERSGDVKHTQADLFAAKRDLDYEPTVKFWEGLESTLAWWDLKTK